MSVTLSVAVESGRLEALPADLLVAPFYETDRPLRGPAAHADWRTCGLLSEQIFAGRVSGAVGEAVLLPSAGRLAAERILALGLGARPGFGEREMTAAAREAGQRAVALRVGIVAVALPSEHQSGVSAALGAAALLAGFCDALRRRPAALRLLLAVGEEEAHRVSQAVVEAAPLLSDDALEVRLEASAGRRVASRPPSVGSEAPRPAAAPAGSRAPAAGEPGPRAGPRQHS